MSGCWHGTPPNRQGPRAVRLTKQQTEIIRGAAGTAFGIGTEVTLFGSRVDDSQRAGDIDLPVRPTDPRQSACPGTA